MSVEIVMPRAGLTMVEGTISVWKAAEGARVDKGQVIMEFENEKNMIEYEALDAGMLHRSAAEGDTVQVGDPIGFLAESEEEYRSIISGAAKDASAADSAEETEKGCARGCPTCVHPQEPAAAPSAASGCRIRATGLAKKMAAEAGIDLADVTPTGGPDGKRIVANDIAAYRKQPKAAAEEAFTEVPWTGIRKTIARNMLSSMQQMAQSTCVCEVDATALLDLRAKLVDEQEFLGCKITVNDLLCKMLGKVLRKHPYANATFDGQALRTYRHVHLSVAVGGENGLMVPVLKNADTLSVCEISAAVKDLAARAKENRLQPDEQSGGTFTITNVGMFPIDIGTPVINPPQVAICGFGRTVRKPVVLDDGTIAPRSMMHVFLTFDHQIMDGLQVGRILKDIQAYIEHPEAILA